MIRSGLSGTNLPVILPDVTMLLRVMLILVAVILSLTSRCSLRRQTRFRLDSQFECSRTYSHQYQTGVFGCLRC